MIKQEVPTSVEKNRFFVLRPSIGPPLFSVINKRGMLAKLGIIIIMRDDDAERDGLKDAMCS